MKRFLLKLSGSERLIRVSSKEDALSNLKKNVCKRCLEEAEHAHDLYTSDGKDFDLYDLLSTPCGCEWSYVDEKYNDIIEKDFD